jgi:hypothetical protein
LVDFGLHFRKHGFKTPFKDDSYSFAVAKRLQEHDMGRRISAFGHNPFKWSDLEMKRALLLEESSLPSGKLLNSWLDLCCGREYRSQKCFFTQATKTKQIV